MRGHLVAEVVGVYFVGDTLDDVLQRVLKALMRSGRPRATATRGTFTEIVGSLIRIRQPRARLSRTEKKGLPFGCLGELVWYLAESDELSFIAHYLPRYSVEAEPNGRLHGAYGPRIGKQLQTVIRLLKKKDSTRRAVVQIFDRRDLAKDYKEIPCTTSFQFLIRNKRLHMFVSMRSNDAYWGLPGDVFAFTMLQEIVARSLDVELGEYTHSVGSLHLYEHLDGRDIRAEANQFIEEGWQQTKPMPAMPLGNPWESLKTLVKAEEGIRRMGSPRCTISHLDPYWMDVLRLLQIHWHARERRLKDIKVLKMQMTSANYDPYIDQRLIRAAKKKPILKQAELFAESSPKSGLR